MFACSLETVINYSKRCWMFSLGSYAGPLFVDDNLESTEICITKHYSTKANLRCLFYLIFYRICQRAAQNC